MPAPVIWNFSVRGAGEAKRELEAVGSATKVLSSDTVTLAKNLRTQARDAQVVINADKYRAQILMAHHPNLVKFTSQMSNLNSILRTAAAAQLLYNTAILISQGQTASLIDLKNDLAREERILADMRAQGLEGTIQEAEQEEKVNRMRAQVTEAIGQQTAALHSQVIATALVGTHIASTLTKNSLLITSLGKVAGAMGYVKFMVGGLATAIAIPLIGVIGGLGKAFGELTSITTIWDKVFGTKMNDFFMTNVGQLFEGKLPAFFQYSAVAFEEMGKRIVGSFSGLRDGLANVWTQLKSGFVGLFNSFATIANLGIGAITKGIEGFVNQAINAVNALIKIFNGAVALVGGKGLSLVPKISLAVPSIPTISAAAGFDGTVSSPTMFLAGEGGQTERVRIGAGNNGNNSGGTTIIVHNHIAGNVWTERQIIDKTRREIDRRLRDLGANR